MSLPFPPCEHEPGLTKSQISCLESNSGSGKSQFPQKLVRAPVHLTHHSQSSIENSTLIISATIPTLRPLFSRNKAGDISSYNSSNQYSHQRWPSRWNHDPEAPSALNSVSGYSDQVELTGANRGEFGIGSDAECVAVGDGDHRKPGGPHTKAPPETGIMKTVNAYVTY
jgi:hypothetical protein